MTRITSSPPQFSSHSNGIAPWENTPSYVHILELLRTRLGHDLWKLGTPVLSTLRLWAARSNQRRTLRGLEEWELKDIGKTMAEVQWEGHKPFWKA